MINKYPAWKDDSKNKVSKTGFVHIIYIYLYITVFSFNLKMIHNHIYSKFYYIIGTQKKIEKNTYLF